MITDYEHVDVRVDEMMRCRLKALFASGGLERFR